FTKASAPIDSFEVPLLADVQWSAHEDLKIVANSLAQLTTDRTIRRDGGHQCDRAFAGQQFRDETDTANVFVTILLAESESSAQMLADHVAVQPFDVAAAACQFFANSS